MSTSPDSSFTAPFSPLSAPASSLERVTCGPAPVWTEDVPYDRTFRGSPEEPYTYLLLSQEHQAGGHAFHRRTAVRLETMQAVQHLSQWQLSFDPATQHVTLHHLRVVRAGQVTDHAQPARLRLLQREAALESFVVDGEVTLLVVLEDVRPGDIIESAYTIVTQPRLLAAHVSAFFALPDALSVGTSLFAVHGVSPERTRWRAAVPDAAPTEETDPAGTMVWRWRSTKHSGQKPEDQVPDGRLPRRWFQVSDVPDWAAIASAVQQAWPAPEATDPALMAETARLSAAAPTLAERVELALRLVQDEFRYLSVNLELGGHVPASPADVLRRRYGDCKDLSFLLVHLLRGLGVEAWPILVHATGSSALGQLLPAPQLFNHAIVEYVLEGQRRWVDATLRLQGGGPLGRFWHDFSRGLRLASDTVDLVAAPPRPSQSDRYEVIETLLLDTTTNGHSLLRIQLRATGRHADTLRFKLANGGPDALADERRRGQASRYRNAEIEAPLQFTDDRVSNEWRMVELYRVHGFIDFSREPTRCDVQLPVPLPLTVLPVPEHGSRLAPWALAEELHLIHEFEVRSRALQGLAPRRSEFTRAWLSLVLLQTSRPGRWTHRTILETRAAEVAASQVSSHRELTTEIWRQCAWSLTVPNGYRREEPAIAAFATLLPPSPPPVVAQTTAVPPRLAAAPEAEAFDKSEPRQRRSGYRRRHRAHDAGSSGPSIPVWSAIALGAVVIRLLLLWFDRP